jgi:hypothetical protein
MNSRITLDRYVYEDIYPAFKATTDEKEITADLVRALLNGLASRELVLTGAAPAPVADIGCGPCDTLVKYLTGVSYSPGFIVRATDYLDKYANEERGEALQILGAAQARQIIKLDSFAARAGDAFDGHIVELLSGRQNRLELRHAFRIVFASHVIYHAGSPAEVRRLFADIATDILSRDGICMLFHIANAPGTFQDFRARFGSEAGKQADSNTGAVTIDDPPAQIRAACEENRLPLYEMAFTAGLRFGMLGDEEWRAFKDPRLYDALAGSNPQAYEDLKRLYFIVQRAPIEFAADHSSKGLDSFIDEIRRVIEDHRGTFSWPERMQVFTRSDANPTLAEAIPEALARSSSISTGKAGPTLA